MNFHHLKLLTKHFNLGTCSRDPKRIYGGLLHVMWRLDTDKGSYAIKQLSKDINLKNKHVMKNYELSEIIASRFIARGIPGICAIAQSGKHLFIIDGSGYLVYPWVNAKALGRGEISTDQALVIARLLAKMHLIDLHVEGIDEPEFNVYDDEYITDLIKQSNHYRLSFAKILSTNLFTLLEVNRSYLGSIKSLRKNTVIGHGDLDQKNVLWNSRNQPLLIDWESARKINSTYEIVNAALDWSGITTRLNVELFRMMLLNYRQAGGLIENDIIEAAFYGAIGNWINWMVYNINRAITSADPEQKNIGIEQVNQVLSTILRIKNRMAELTITVMEINL